MTLFTGDKDKDHKKWFVIATEGATTDGRKIERKWLTEAEESYDPKNVYGARINLEHMHWRYMFDNDPHALMYGDVLALKTKERKDGKLQLLAQLAPTDRLIELNKQRQKIYTSIEIDPDFGDTGKAYLVGLAVTDSPASLGTEMLTFARQAKNNPFAERKINPQDYITEAIELLEFVETEPKEKKMNKTEQSEKNESIFEKVKNLLTANKKNEDARFTDLTKAIELLSAHSKSTGEKNEELSQKVAEQAETINKLSKELTELNEKFNNALKHSVGSDRPLALGGAENTFDDDVF